MSKPKPFVEVVENTLNTMLQEYKEGRDFEQNFHIKRYFLVSAWFFCAKFLQGMIG